MCHDYMGLRAVIGHGPGFSHMHAKKGKKKKNPNKNYFHLENLGRFH